MQMNRTALYSVVVFLAVSTLTYLAYGQGFSAEWSFDDTRSLRGLEKVSDVDSAFEFLATERRVSPMDRPLSMATFLLHTQDWPRFPQPFRHVNVLIHIFNGILVALVAIRVARFVPSLAPRAIPFAVSLAAAWMVLPFLASTTWMIIQRMTLLAATFSLLGILGYLYGRTLLEHRPKAAYAWMSASLFLGTTLGVLAKENAALTPLMVATLEFTVLSVYAPVAERHLKTWRILFFGVPTALVVGYLLYSVPYMLEAFTRRPFTLNERLFSETVILFEYIQQMLVPDIGALGPFQDDYARIRGIQWQTLIATLAWAGLIGLAFAVRRRAPALSFAVLFFLAGHVIESTVVSLELYFEHRNYLPSLGILGGLFAFAWSRDAWWPKVATGIYTVTMAALLFRTVSVWGNTGLAAEQWYEAHPTSTRAVQYLSTQYQRAGQYTKAAGLILQAYRAKPLDGGLALQAFITQCFSTNGGEREQLVEQIAADAPRLTFSSGAPKALHSIIDIHVQGHCDAFQPHEAITIARGLLANPGYQFTDISEYALFLAIARAQELAGDKAAAIDAKIAAFRKEPAPQVVVAIFKDLRGAGRDDDLRAFLAEARNINPSQTDLYDKLEGELSPH